MSENETNMISEEITNMGGEFSIGIKNDTVTISIVDANLAKIVVKAREINSFNLCIKFGVDGVGEIILESKGD